MVSTNDRAVETFSTLQDKFVYDLDNIYDAEHRFQEAQQQMLQQEEKTAQKLEQYLSRLLQQAPSAPASAT